VERAVLARTVADDPQAVAFAHPEVRVVAFGGDEILGRGLHRLRRTLSGEERGRRGEREPAEDGGGKGHRGSPWLMVSRGRASRLGTGYTPEVDRLFV
ncbi:MAG: hypothetical protein ACK55I_33990, partial [bacterium]